jgi:Holliday junction resolvase RusA-like endonuclease
MPDTMTARTVAVTLPVVPVPPSSLSPNSRRRLHWSAVARDTKQYRQDVGWSLKSQADMYREALERMSMPYVLTVDVFWPLKRKLPDNDALASMVKPAVDALVDIGILDDDSPDEIGAVMYRQRHVVPGGEVGLTMTFATPDEPGSRDERGAGR